MGVSKVNSGGIQLLNSEIYISEVSISSAEMLAIFTTPKLLVAAPGAGKYIDPISVIAKNTFNSVAYSTGSSPYINYVGTASSVKFTFSTDLITTSSTRVEKGMEYTDTVVPVNVGLQFLNGANPTLGNGTLKLSLLYRIVTI